MLGITPTCARQATVATTRDRQVQRPARLEHVQQLHLPMHQPAEAERAAECCHRGDVRQQRHVRRRNSEPGSPSGQRHQRGAGRRSEHQYTERTAHDRANDTIEARSAAACTVEPDHDRARQQRQAVKPQQHVQEPQMRQRKCQRRCVRIRRRLASATCRRASPTRPRSRSRRSTRTGTASRPPAASRCAATGRARTRAARGDETSDARRNRR